MKRKLVAILAADVSGYSRLVAQDEEGTLARLIADRRVFDDIAGRWAGRVFNVAGDAILAEFRSAEDALRAAVAIQAEIHRRNAPEAEARRMLYRIGLTTGSVVEQDGDLLGDGVNVAARLENLAEPGGICLSRSVHEEVGGALPLRMRSIGPQRLKNMPQPVHAYLVAPESLGPGRAGRATRRRLRPWAIALGVLACVGAAAGVLSRHATVPRPAAALAEAAGPSRTLVFGPEPELPVETPPEPRRPFDVAAMPFIGDAGRARVASEIAKGTHHAVALAHRGAFGVAAGRDSVDAAEEGALNDCFSAQGLNCRLFEVDGVDVSAATPPPMPPRPWVDAGAPRTPFDAGRVAGVKDASRQRLAAYAAEKPPKALALGPHGVWFYRAGRRSLEEAERLALEFCGEDVGTPCRIVAVNDDFVVPLRAP